MAAAIIGLIASVLSLAYKVWSDWKSYKAVSAELAVTKRALERAVHASEEGNAYANRLEASMRAHLKGCNAPLSTWANELLGGPKASGKPDGS